VKSLRARVLLGAALWTLGLTAVWAIVLTFYVSAFHSVYVIHSHPHALMVVAVASMVAGFAVVRAGLAPFNEMRRRLGDVQRGTARQLSGAYPTEVTPLVRDLNALLAHRDHAVSRALGKAGDLAHGLKTPLAILAQEADRAAEAGQSELASAIGEQVERMRRQIDYHLAHARAAASGALPGARCSVVESADALSRTLLRLHADRGIAIEVRVPGDHVVRCQREDLDEMLGNLLDNACKWAGSRVSVSSAIGPRGRDLPPNRLRQGYGESAEALRAKAEGRSHENAPEPDATRGSDELAGGSGVDGRVVSSDDGAIVEITVDDDGPGIEASLRDSVMLRGVRADEAAPGSGFGLAIVRELAELYGGSIALETAASGGLRARLRLPSAGGR
jgi:signal transduction histidine kinase